MKITLKSADMSKSMIVDGTITFVIVKHNLQAIRTLAGAGAVTSVGSYNRLELNLSKVKQSDWLLLNEITSGRLHVSTENFVTYYNVVSSTNEIPKNSESQNYFSTTLTFEDKIHFDY